MGAGERRRYGRRRGVMVKITNKDNPQLAARMASFGHCGIIFGSMLMLPGLILTAIGALFGTFHLYIGPALLGIGFILLIASLLVCLFIVKPSCCYPKDPVVGTSMGGILVAPSDPANAAVGGQQSTVFMTGGAPQTMGQPQPLHSQYATNYGTAYGQPVAPPQYSTGTAPPPSYQQANLYSATTDSNAVYPPPPPATY